jgi:D-amino-acid dehydrogenase
MEGALVRLIVVGSGVVGASCAYAAASLGAGVVLVDAGLRGRATAAGAGIICPWSSRVDDPVWYSFAREAARNYPELVQRLTDAGEPDVGYRRVGALALAASEADREEIRRLLLARRADAPEVGELQDLSGEQARGLFPPLRVDTLAVHISGAARVDGRLLAAALVRAAVRQGAAVVKGTAGLECHDGRAIGVTVGGDLIKADAVVVAAGAWTRSFLEPSGVTVHVGAQRGQIGHISLGSADTSTWPVILPGRGGHYMLAFDDSRVVAGATRETGSGFDYRVTPGGLAEVLREALAVAPGLASGTYAETRVGFRPMGPDIRPLLGPVPAVPGVVVATGLGASGLTMGPYAGMVAARTALDLPVDVDLGPLDPLRPPV